MKTNLSVLVLTLPVVAGFCPPIRGQARFFLDTADPQQWEKWLPTGIFTGVTTNPLLLERAQQPCTIPHIHKLCETALAYPEIDEIMVQSWGDDLYGTGMELSAPNREQIVIKVPTTEPGLKAAARLIRSGCRVCLTVCYDPPKQALLAATSGAEYLAPYHGRLADEWGSSERATQSCIRSHQVARGLQSQTRILVASLRRAQTVVDLAAAGLDTFTFGPHVAEELFDTPLTERAAAEFESAAVRMSDSNQLA